MQTCLKINTDMNSYLPIINVYIELIVSFLILVLTFANDYKFFFGKANED
jgi:hypothetical protein